MSTAGLWVFSGIFLGALIITALLVRRGANLRANRLLAASLGTTMLYLIAVASLHAGRGENSALLFPLGMALLLSPPLMYGYVQLLIDPGFRFRPRHLVHLLPFSILAVISMSGVSEGLTLSEEALQQARSGWPPSPIAMVAIVMYLLQIGYLAKARALTVQHRMALGNRYSYEEQVTLSWLRVLVSVYLGLSIIALLVAILRLTPGVELWPRTLTSSFMIIMMYYLIAFLAISQPALPGDSVSRESADDEPESPGTRYQGSSLDEAMIASHWETLESIMQEQRPHLNSKLKIADLAELLSIPSHHLSQTINQVAGQNFFEFINRHRVGSAIELIELDDRSMTAVAFDAGFNSQSAFYRQFKKITGQTPRQFQLARTKHPQNTP